MLRLKELRKRHKATQQQVADYLQITRQAYGHYETGARTPDLETLKKIAAYYGVSADYILGMGTDTGGQHTDFLDEVKKKYGYQGRQEAERVLNEMLTLFSGGKLPEEDKDEMFRVFTQMYFDAKESQRKKKP